MAFAINVRLIRTPARQSHSCSLRRLAQVRMCHESETSLSIYSCANCGAEMLLSSTKCENCGTGYESSDVYIDRVKKDAAVKGGIFGLNIGPLRQEMFRSPVISYLYERGWRRAFQTYGFPGPDKEFQMLLDCCEENGKLNGTIADISCGSGFMARKMAASDKFKNVIVSDFSESMLREAKTRFDNTSTSLEGVDFVRADVAKLPFKTDSLDVIHNGAAIHTYPCPQDALREMRRVLCEGGVLFGTTIDKGVFSYISRQPTNGFRFFSNEEVYYLLRAAGFENPIVKSLNNCLLFQAVK